MQPHWNVKAIYGFMFIANLDSHPFVAAMVAAGGVGATDSARLIVVTARFATTKRPHADRIVHVLDSSSAQRAVALATKAAFLVDRKVEVRYQSEFGNARAISMTPLRAGAIGGVLALHAKLS